MYALVIDDEAQLRGFVGAVLRNEGWEVCEAESAEQAFEMLRDQDWAVVFCDVMMGGATSLAS
jgi:DNA-binding response OmpR family regulator